MCCVATCRAVLTLQIATLHRNFGIQSVYLTECQSYPLVMATDVEEMLRIDADGKPAYSPLEVLEGDVVVSNHEVGYWATRLCHSYPNPLLVKLVRTLWEESADFTVFGECHWGRSAAVVRSGVVAHVRHFRLDVVCVGELVGDVSCVHGGVAAVVVVVVNAVHDSYCWRRFAVESVPCLPTSKIFSVSPCSIAGCRAPACQSLDFVDALAATVNRAVDKLGTVSHCPQDSGSSPVSKLYRMLEVDQKRLPRGAELLQLRSLCSARHPYPALLLGANTWTAVDVQYCLPGIPVGFQVRFCVVVYLCLRACVHPCGCCLVFNSSCACCSNLQPCACCVVSLC